MGDKSQVLESNTNNWLLDKPDVPRAVIRKNTNLILRTTFPNYYPYYNLLAWDNSDQNVTSDTLEINWKWELANSVCIY